MDAYKLFGLPKDFGVGRWERLKLELEHRPEMDIEVFVPPRDRRQDLPLEQFFAAMAEEIQARLNREMGQQFTATYIGPVEKNFFHFRIARLQAQ